MNEFQKYIQDRRSYWNKTGKYQGLLDTAMEEVPKSGPSDSESIEQLRLAVNAYSDYFNNGGCNRPQRLHPMIESLDLKRGSPGSRAKSKLRRYDNGSLGYMPEGLWSLYDDIIDSVMEQYFHAELAYRITGDRGNAEYAHLPASHFEEYQLKAEEVRNQIADSMRIPRRMMKDRS